jgi:hypothetical protein
MEAPTGSRSGSQLRTALARHRAFACYVAASLAVVALLLADPLFNGGEGLTLALLRGTPRSRGSCSYDQEGSWSIGTLSGSSPLAANISTLPVLSCAHVANTTPASYVAEPALLIPPRSAGESPLTAPRIEFEQREASLTRGPLR